MATLYIKVKLLPEEDYRADADEIYAGDLFSGHASDRVRMMSETEEDNVTGRVTIRDS